MLKFLLFFFCLCTTAWALPSYPPEIRLPLEALDRIEEGHTLLSEAEKEGLVAIKFASLGRSAPNAMWAPGKKTIYLNTSNFRSMNSLLHSIVFELHNVISTKQFYYYDRLVYANQVTRDQFVEAIEYIEYSNALKTSQLIAKGVQMRLFPADARYDVAPTFAEHYHIQIQAGHSALIGSQYDDMKRSFG